MTNKKSTKKGDEEAKKKAPKSRYFTYLLYPENLPNGWLDALKLTEIPMAISPVHDKDLKKFFDEEDPYKKAHYHVIYIASNPVTASAVKNRINRVLDDAYENEHGKSFGQSFVSLVQIIKTSVRSVYTYFTHETPDAIKKGKALYDAKDIVCINAFDVDRYDVLDVEKKEDFFYEAVDKIVEKKFVNIIELERDIRNNPDDYTFTLKQFRSIIEFRTGLLRLYFDGAYQIKNKRFSNEVLSKIHEAGLSEDEFRKFDKDNLPDTVRSNLEELGLLEYLS